METDKPKAPSKIWLAVEFMEEALACGDCRQQFVLDREPIGSFTCGGELQKFRSADR
jgi:hypothetical protein